MKKSTCLVLVLLAAALTGCQSPAPESSQAALTDGIQITPDSYKLISGDRWTLVAMTVDGQTTQLEEPRPWIQFEDDFQVTGQGPINRYFGGFEMTQSGQLRWPAPLGFTRMAGSLALMGQEIAYFKALPQTDRMILTNNELTLTNEAGTIELVYAAQNR